MRNKFHGLCTAFAFAFVSSANADAQNQQLGLSGLMPNYNVSQIEGLLTYMGATYQINTLDNGGQYFIVKASDGTNHILEPAACTDGNCAGLKMITIYNGWTVDLISANKFNSINNAARVIIDEDDPNRLYFYRYLIGDYGYTRGAFVVNMNVFVRTRLQLENFLNQSTAQSISFDASTETVSAAINLPPGASYPTDRVAEQLNELEKVTNQTRGATNIAPQVASFEPENRHDLFSIDGFPIEAENTLN